MMDVEILRFSDFDLSLYVDRLDKRLKRFPEATGIQALKDIFLKAKEKYSWATSMIICKFWLGKYIFPKSLQGKYEKGILLSPDTAPECEAHRHKLEFVAWMGRIGLKAISDEGEGPRGFAPLRYAAVAAGLGIFRKNNFFYDEKGSWHKLEAFLIDHDCEYISSSYVKLCPDKCVLCIRYCPTGSLCEPHMMNPLKCIAFITNFGGGNVPAPLSDSDVKDWISGCDACQDACPFNKTHNWQEGKRFHELEDVVELLQPRRIIDSTDQTLWEKVIPRLGYPHRPDQA